MAKTGVLHSKRQLTPGPDPAYVSVPYASFAAGQTAVQGILAALFERESSGLGQVVEANLVSGVGALDTYNWFYEMILRRYPDAFTPLADAFDAAGRPQSRLMYALLVAATKDGTWLQFAQTAPRLTQAFLEELGLAEEVRRTRSGRASPTCRRRSCARSGGTRCSPRWASGRWRSGKRSSPATPTCSASSSARRTRRSRTRSWSTRAASSRSTTPTSGRSGSPPRWCTRAAARSRRSAGPRGLDEHSREIRGLAASPRPDKPAGGTEAGAAWKAARDCPLAGVTMLELGGMFAAPFGATVLADLGARVIKVEPLDGDTIRGVMAFPEAGGGKVLQGKESIALDIRTPEGLAVVHEIARRCDVVLQCYRAGVAARIGIDEAALKAVNPAPGLPERARLRHRRAVRRQARLRAVDRRGVRGLADRRPARRRASGNPRAAAERRAQPPGGRHGAGRPVRRHRRPRGGLRPAARPVRPAARDRADRHGHDHARHLHPGADRPEHQLPGPSAAEPGRRRVPRPRPALPAVPGGGRLGVPRRPGPGGVGGAAAAGRSGLSDPRFATAGRPRGQRRRARRGARRPSSRPAARTSGRRS